MTITSSRRGGQLKKSSKDTPKTPKRTSPESIAQKATRGQDVSGFFTNEFKVVRPVRVVVDVNPELLRKVDARAARLKVSREAIIQSLVERSFRQPTGRR